MKQFYLLLIVILFVVKGFSQKDTFTIGRNQIKFSPFRTIDIVNPGVELSYERLLSKYYSTQISAAYMFNMFGIAPFYNVHGYRLAAEEKHFIRQRNIHKTYVSLEAVYYHTHFGSNYGNTSSDSNYIRRYTATINAKYGWQIYFNKHLMLDIGCGLGVKYVDAKILYSHKIDDADDDIYSAFPGLFAGVVTFPGHYFTINIPFNIKIGYSF